MLAMGSAVLISGCSQPFSVLKSEGSKCEPTSGAWPMAGFDAARTSVLSAQDVPDTSLPAQAFVPQSANFVTNAPPVVTDGVVYTAGSNRVDTRSLNTGQQYWEVEMAGETEVSPVVTCDSLVVSTHNETVAYSLADGRELWRTDSGSINGSPVAHDGTVFVGETGRVIAIDGGTGKKRWEQSADANGIAVGERVYAVAGANDRGAVTAITHHGDRFWHTDGLEPLYATPALGNGTLFAPSKTGTLYALDTDDGSLQWEQPIEQGVYESPAVGANAVIVAAGNGERTIAVDATTGKQRWTHRTGVSQSGPVIVGDRVVSAGANTGIFLLDLHTGEQLRHWPVTGVGSQVIPVDGRLLYRRGFDSVLVVIESR